MSRRLLNKNNLGTSSSSLPVENPMELIKPKPIVPHTFIPNEPIILTKEQWEAVCERTYDATIPFKVEVTVIEKIEQQRAEVEEVNEEEEMKEEVYVPKRVRKSKK